jgi:hypothetical protein
MKSLRPSLKNLFMGASEGKQRWPALSAKVIGALMWCWIFWRAKQDGPVMLVSYMVIKIIIIFWASDHIFLGTQTSMGT